MLQTLLRHYNTIYAPRRLHPATSPTPTTTPTTTTISASTQQRNSHDDVHYDNHVYNLYNANLHSITHTHHTTTTTHPHTPTAPTTPPFAPLSPTSPTSHRHIHDLYSRSLPAHHTGFLSSLLPPPRPLDALLACHKRSRHLRLLDPHCSLALLRFLGASWLHEPWATTLFHLPPPPPNSTSSTVALGSHCTAMSGYYYTSINRQHANSPLPLRHTPLPPPVALVYVVLQRWGTPRTHDNTSRLLASYDAATTTTTCLLHPCLSLTHCINSFAYCWHTGCSSADTAETPIFIGIEGVHHLQQATLRHARSFCNWPAYAPAFCIHPTTGPPERL